MCPRGGAVLAARCPMQRNLTRHFRSESPLSSVTSRTQIRAS
ncbi:hypothetical protein EIB18_14545 [Caulobacter vibrioides]|uniref:Uncharacterized protein n=1 Tax=Caulobacter vibrioides (strain NA1000 / CB15N) TaxID=565050 RepID=A0A0H3IWK8_CAUVN|nr:hypothetical protein [Caulobacter vibrioides]YP_009020552.1 hypothetical protein CCNA_03980 [Caulobacter vibrioides NA1000]AHI88583.1 hypothetical protein CCNA_03980 [Caulobacter vibrioides NA1000]AVH77098.1 hypothetical protein CA607_20535 [Caulobacter vibrioides]AZH14844.1 hypothetical protein EIB18_14545 [Caulobacter vibrioides]QXZ51098.1 hypothetical protein KZH45_14570 [Caulobacter vibrioides]